jgi:hypothetical protein
MIPLDIIRNNAVLEEHILAKDIIAAMKWYLKYLFFRVFCKITNFIKYIILEFLKNDFLSIFIYLEKMKNCKN